MFREVQCTAESINYHMGRTASTAGELFDKQIIQSLQLSSLQLRTSSGHEKRP